MKASLPPLMVMVLLAGCAVPPREALPTVEWNDHRDARRILAARAAAIDDISAQGLLTLQRPDGQSVRLDVALVSDGRYRTRLRAWKLGRAVFDLTVNHDGMFLLTPDDPSLNLKARSAGASARQLAESWSMFNGGLFRRGDARFRDEGDRLIVSLLQSGTLVRCEVDRRTLTPRRYVMSDAGGVNRFTLELSEYRLVNDVPVPFRHVATSDQGRIVIALREVEINAGLADGAFVPPRRAEKLP